MTVWAFAIAACVTVHRHDYCSTLRDRYVAEETCDRSRAAMEELFKHPKMTFVCVRERRRVATRRWRPAEPLTDGRRA